MGGFLAHILIGSFHPSAAQLAAARCECSTIFRRNLILPDPSVLRSCPMWRRCAGVSIICIHHTVIDYVVIVLEHSLARLQGGEQDYTVTK